MDCRIPLSHLSWVPSGNEIKHLFWYYSRKHISIKPPGKFAHTLVYYCGLEVKETFNVQGTYKYSKDSMLPREEGIEPLNALLEKSNITSFVKFPSVDGIAPVRLFECNLLRYHPFIKSLVMKLQSDYNILLMFIMYIEQNDIFSFTFILKKNL